MSTSQSRFFLSTPHGADAKDSLAFVDAVLDADADIASLLIDYQSDNEAEWVRLAKQVCDKAQPKGIAVLVKNESRIAGRSGADGIHVDQGLAAVRDAVDRLQGKMIIGAGGISSRHEAMEMGEAGADYLFFGRLDKPPVEGGHKKSYQLGLWWAELFQIPAALQAGSDVASLEPLIEGRIDFILPPLGDVAISDIVERLKAWQSKLPQAKRQ